MPDDTKLPVAATTHAMPFEAMQRLAESVARSGLFGIRTPDQAMALMAIAQAEGRHPALAARDYHVIQGSPAKKAEAMARDFLSAGGRIEWHQLDDAAADATFSHPAGGTARIKWDQARVTQAGLGSNPMHKRYPRQMLRSRTVSEGVRTVWPVATSGMYVPEELADVVPAARPMIDITPPGSQYDAGPAHAAAKRGVDSFRAYWRDLDVDQRAMLRPDLASYQRVSEEADRARADEDPFGLPPLGSATEPPADDTPTRKEDATGLGGPDAPAGEPGDPRPWRAQFAALDPADLAGEPDWPRYGAAAKALIARAASEDLNALKLADNPHMRALRLSDSSDLYREIVDAVRERSAVLAGGGDDDA